MLAQEVGVVELLVQHGLEHRQAEIEVGARPGGDPFVGLGRRLGLARIQRHHLGTVLAAGGETHHATGGYRADGGVIGHKQDVLGVVEIGQHLVVDIEVAGHRIGAQVAGGDAVLHRRGDDIRDAVGERERHRPIHIEHAGGPAAHHGPFPGLDIGLLVPLGDVGIGLFPTGGAELGLAALAALDPDQRRLEAIGVIGLAQTGLAAGANLAAIERRIGVAVELDDALDVILGSGGDPDIAQG